MDSPSQLKEYLAQRTQFYHDTRHFPKRASEILDGGSLYWIIKGEYGLRQPIVDLVPLGDPERGKFCRIMFAPELIAVRGDKHRAFQGWRYLELDNAPSDSHIDVQGNALPSSLSAELSAYGIL